MASTVTVGRRRAIDVRKLTRLYLLYSRFRNGSRRHFRWASTAGPCRLLSGGTDPWVTG